MTVSVNLQRATSFTMFMYTLFNHDLLTLTPSVELTDLYMSGDMEEMLKRGWKIVGEVVTTTRVPGFSMDLSDRCPLSRRVTRLESSCVGWVEDATEFPSPDELMNCLALQDPWFSECHDSRGDV